MKATKFWKDVLDLLKDYAPTSFEEGTGIRLMKVIEEKYEELVTSFGKEFVKTIEGEIQTSKIKNSQELEDFILAISTTHYFKDIDIKDFLTNSTIIFNSLQVETKNVEEFVEEPITENIEVEEVIESVPEVEGMVVEENIEVEEVLTTLEEPIVEKN